jgi:hypothetical protein
MPASAAADAPVDAASASADDAKMRRLHMACQLMLLAPPLMRHADASAPRENAAATLICRRCQRDVAASHADVRYYVRVTLIARQRYMRRRMLVTPLYYYFASDADAEALKR